MQTKDCMQFKDRFSGHAAEYAQYRPRYPAELFEYVAAVAPDRTCAWDCATGNGQAASGLANLFECVIATDASEKQIANAERNDRITYRVATAEDSGLEPGSVSLVTVAQALHWLRIEAFYNKVKRVLKPGGALAIWCYNLFEISPPIDALVTRFYRETVGPYWDPERHLVETGYRTLPFPFAELETPKFQMQANWSLNHLLGYLRTWSATKKFIGANGLDPATSLANELTKLWGDPTMMRKIEWPLKMRVGTVPF
jgi:SAM-dependent methyltransferase